MGIEDLLENLQLDSDMVHQLQIERDDLMDERPTYCVWTLHLCKDGAETEHRLHLDIVDPTEFDCWTVSSYWEKDAFPYANCPLQYLVLATTVIDLDWRVEVLQNHRELADTLEVSYLHGTVQ
jgi:hypothetical protein